MQQPLVLILNKKINTSLLIKIYFLVLVLVVACIVEAADTNPRNNFHNYCRFMHEIPNRVITF